MPEARISPKVIFIGCVRAVIPHESTDHASREAARDWALSAWAHKARAFEARGMVTVVWLHHANGELIRAG
jgi:molybdopterin synthase catalytic subunit